MWIPLKYVYNVSNTDSDRDTEADISIGKITNLTITIRDYSVQREPLHVNKYKSDIEICNFNASNIQFRWLQSSQFKVREGENSARDLWSLDDINISYITEDGEWREIINDSFDSGQLK